MRRGPGHRWIRASEPARGLCDTVQVGHPRGAPAPARETRTPPGVGGLLALGLAVLLSGLLPCVAASQEEIPDFSEEWRWADFGRETGFLGRRVGEMYEVGDTLWVRSDQGLFWYAGFHWWEVGVDQGLPPGVVFAMAPFPDGPMAVSVNGRVYLGGAESFRSLDPPGWRETGYIVRDLVATSQELLVLASHPAGEGFHLFLLGPDSFSEFPPPGPIQGNPGLSPSRDGSPLLETGDGLYRFLDGEWIPVVGGGREPSRFSSVREGPDGSWLAFQTDPEDNRGFLIWGEGGPVRRLPPEGEHRALSGILTSSGLLIALYETGDIREWNGGSWRTPSFPTLRREGLHYAFEDHLGDLWFASGRGLHMFRRSFSRWTSLSFPFPDSRNRVNDLLVSRTGDLWMATHGGVARVGADGGVEWLMEALGTELSGVTGLAEDSAGGIWMGSGASFTGVFRRDGDRWERFGPDEGGPPGNIHRISAGGDGSLWFASLGSGPESEGAGAYRWAHGILERVMDDRGWLGGRTYAIQEGIDGEVWFGTGMGLLRLRDGEWTHWGPSEGVGRDGATRVFTVLPDSQGGVLLGFGPGLRMGVHRVNADGSVSNLSEVSGLAHANVNQIVRDDRGVVWVSSDRGIARYTSGHWTILDESVGLTPAASWPLAFRPGEVLVGTTGGGLRVLSRREEGNPPPRIHVTAQPTAQGRAIRIPFRVAAYRGQSDPGQLRVRHRFPGKDWSGWGTAREVTSTPDDDLGYGTQTILIQAKDAFGGLSAPLEVEVEIPPPIYLRPFFFIPVGVMALAVLVALLMGRARKQKADAALRQSESTLRTLVESAPDGIAIYDADADRFLNVNANVLALTGTTREEFLSTHLGDTSPSSLPNGSTGRSFLLQKVDEALGGKSVTFEWYSGRRGEAPIPVEMRLVRLPSKKGRLVRFSVLDIRDRKEAEEKRRELEGQLRQSQKLEAVGQLTGGVAHDFNNLLTVILGNLDLLKELKGTDPESLDLIKGAIGAAERSALLTQRLLAFSRRQALDSKPLELRTLVEGLLALLKRSLGETIQIHTEFSPDLWLAKADPGQLEHALVNLAVNARDAMPRGGDLFLEGANVRVEPELAEKWGGEAGAYVRLSVTDTGVGMDSQTRERAIDPFFTTKEVGAGSGLGLSMVYGFVKQSGGFIKIHSELGRGTAVQLFLPRATDGLVPDPAMDKPTGETPKGRGEVILVVEDEPLLLKLTTSLCEKLGYEAVGASVGRGALEYLRSGQPVDLLFTDVILPGGMDGVQLALEARGLRPNLPVLFTTGYAEQSVWRLARDLEDYELITKPFDTATLAWKLHGMLAE